MVGVFVPPDFQCAQAENRQDGKEEQAMGRNEPAHVSHSITGTKGSGIGKQGRLAACGVRPYLAEGGARPSVPLNPES
jgi:hypothetical protein